MQRMLLILVASAAVWSQPPAHGPTVIGSWEGESKCAAPNSPCQDEQVLYQIAEDKKDPWQLTLDTYKVIDATPEFMGTLTCHYQAKAGALSCTSSTTEKDDWEFRVMGDAMSGVLKIDDGKTIYRRITLHRSPK